MTNYQVTFYNPDTLDSYKAFAYANTPAQAKAIAKNNNKARLASWTKCILTASKNFEELKLEDRANLPERLTKRMTLAERQEVRQAKTQKYLDNDLQIGGTNPGGRGAGFENLCRDYLKPKSSILRMQAQNRDDLTITTKNGKILRIECKTGGGELAQGIPLNWQEELQPQKDFKFDYIFYVPFFNPNLTIEEQTIVMSKSSFLDWLASYNPKKGIYGLLKYHPTRARVMLQNPCNGSVGGRVGKTEAYFSELANLESETFKKYAMTLPQFLAMVKNS